MTSQGAASATSDGTDCSCDTMMVIMTVVTAEAYATHPRHYWNRCGDRVVAMSTRSHYRRRRFVVVNNGADR